MRRHTKTVFKRFPYRYLSAARPARAFAVHELARPGAMPEPARFRHWRGYVSSGALGFLGQLHGLLVAAPAKALPESLRGKARQDALRLRPGLKVILGEGRIEVDNHWVENGMRSIVLGRKNWLQTSSKATGHWGAAAGGVGI